MSKPASGGEADRRNALALFRPSTWLPRRHRIVRDGMSRRDIVGARFAAAVRLHDRQGRSGGDGRNGSRLVSDLVPSRSRHRLFIRGRRHSSRDLQLLRPQPASRPHRKQDSTCSLSLFGARVGSPMDHTDLRPIPVRSTGGLPRRNDSRLKGNRLLGSIRAFDIRPECRATDSAP